LVMANPLNRGKKCGPLAFARVNERGASNFNMASNGLVSSKEST